MADKTWKKAERRICRYFGAERNPLSGENSRHTRSDCLHETLYIEVKHRKKHSAVTLCDDTAKKAKKEGKIPVVCLAEKGRHGFWILVHCDHLSWL